MGLTFGTLAVLLVLYATRIVRPTEKFKMGLFAATGAICLFYMASLVLGLFGIQIPLIHSSGTFGIAFSVFVVIIAALNLVLDFEIIETGVNNGPRNTSNGTPLRPYGHACLALSGNPPAAGQTQPAPLRTVFH